MKLWNLCLFVLVLMGMAVIAQDALDTVRVLREIEQIREIQEQTGKASWTAGITSHSYMSKDEISALCGLLVDPKEFVDDDVTPLYGPTYTIDLRKSGKIGSIKDQGKCGSCWAFAIIAAVESGHYGRDLSEQYLVSCCHSMANGCYGGSLMWPIRWIIDKEGVFAENVYPYTSGTTQKSGECLDVTGQRYRIYGYDQHKTQTEVTNKLYAGRPVITGMKVYEDFRHYKSGVYKHVSGEYLGDHAVLIVGFNSTAKYWIVKNSWGTDWGEGGYFLIAYEECEIPWSAISVR